MTSTQSLFSPSRGLLRLDEGRLEGSSNKENFGTALLTDPSPLKDKYREVFGELMRKHSVNHVATRLNESARREKKKRDRRRQSLKISNMLENIVSPSIR